MKGLVREYIQKITSDYSHGSHASCVHSIKNTSDYSDGSHHASFMHSFWSYSLCPHINDSTLSQVVLLMLLLPNKSTVKYSLTSHPHSILQHQSLSVSGCGGIRRVWRLRTTLREPVREFTRTNEVAKHIIELILTHEQDHYGIYSLWQTFRK